MSDIDLVRIRGQNVLPFSQIDIPLENQGLVCLFGVNLDEYGRGNGSGKSSVVDIIKGSLYARSGRKTKGKNLANTVTKEPLSLEMEFRVHGHPYKTVLSYGLSKKDDAQADGLRLFDLMLPPGEADISKKGKVEQQIARLLGIPFDIFEGSVCVGQKTSHRFVYGTNMDRQVFFAQLGGFERWRLAQEEARSLKKELADRGASLQERISALHESKSIDSSALYDPDELDSEIFALNQKKDLLEKQKQDVKNNRRSLEARITALNAQKAELDALVRKIESSKDLEEEIEEKKAELEELASRLGPYVDESLFEGKRDSILSKLSTAQAHISMLKERIDALREASSVCPVCESDLPESKKAALLAESHQKLVDQKASEKKLLSKKETLAEFSELLSSYRRLSHDLASLKIPDVDDFDEASYRDLKAEIQQLAKDKVSEDNRYDDISDQLTDATSKIGKLEERLRSAVESEKKTVERELRLKQLSEELEQTQRRMDLIHVAAEEVFPAIRASNIRDLLDTLNQDVASHVSQLFRTPIRAFAKFKVKGSSEDELALYVEDDVKGRLPVDEWSGGEGKRVVISFMFSLWKLAGAVHRSVNFAAYDEILADVDKVGQLQIIDMLRGMRDEGKTILITSNEDPRTVDLDLFDQVWVAKKENGLSTLVTNPLDVQELLEQNVLSE